MTTFALVGAGPGLGLAAARRFGAAGHTVALIARDGEKLDGLTADLARDGIQARGYPADVLDIESLTAALHAAKWAWGTGLYWRISMGPRSAALGRGTLLFVNGSSAVRPNPKVAGTSIAFAAESAYAHMLHDALAPENIHAAQLIIPGADIHTDRDGFRHYSEPLPD
ncbi:SDR family NAD(P)-dependent oxidoreductase [Streptomyces sp. NPDC052682]|uniref:SDR family NAD(P)-dependent oxidoreductase n=1 Tax=Streptomyces sp. NPDC052682 TaxID=3154954 RepID=UPI003439D250